MPTPAVTDALVARALDWLEARLAAGDGAPRLADAAAAVGLSAPQLRRRFTLATGVSPAAWVRARRAHAFRVALRREPTVSAATFAAGYSTPSRAAGYSTPSRAYADAERHLGMSPAAYREGGAGEVITWATRATALGHLVLGATARGTCWVSLGDDVAVLVDELRDEFPRARLVAAPDDTLDDALRAVESRLRGDADAPAVPMDVRATPFQERVLDALQRIPFGEVRSYAQVAADIGAPKAARAVANACATNRLAVLIPCHRVLHGDGTMSGYRWGNAVKRALLAAEGAPTPRGDGAPPAAVRRRLARVGA
ncbi:MAG: methylated-DNA--[protein]-cysteine S-methyltransferase [Gemmatimonadaceae bacterium]|nr:methylated-DNA--[protein]-cysteine S-methyltransferase [Gemmatimonadaceae bacterium]